MSVIVPSNKPQLNGSKSNKGSGDTKQTLSRLGELKMSDDDDSDTPPLGSSPSSQSAITGSELFKTVLNDYFIGDENESRVSKAEFDRYASRKANKNRNAEDHARSERCGSCQAVMTMCRCAMYGGAAQQFGHRVHWADEVWNKPLTTLLEEMHLEDSVDDGSIHVSRGHRTPKPILKHRATCVIIVSE